MANTVIRKKLAAKVDDAIILLVNRVFVSDTKKCAITAIENPPSSELIVIICSASLFQYSKVISVIILFFYHGSNFECSFFSLQVTIHKHNCAYFLLER